jgi:hypothetical protein
MDNLSLRQIAAETRADVSPPQEVLDGMTLSLMEFYENPVLARGLPEFAREFKYFDEDIAFVDEIANAILLGEQVDLTDFATVVISMKITLAG